MSSDLPNRGGEPTEIDDEIDEFAETAFDALLMGGETKQPSESPEFADAVESVDEGTGEYEDVELDDVIMVSDVPPDEVSSATLPPSAPPPASVRPATAPPAPSEAPATGQIEVARLRSEISGLKAKLAESSGGVSSRQFLDLREALNTKDKQILELRDQVSGRDKEIIDLRDQSIGLERARADFDEKIAELEHSLSSAQESIATLTEDKESANKRYEDVKARFERENAKVETLESELAQEREARVADVEALKGTQDAEMARLRVAQEEAMDLVKAES
ncbi:MAG: hypothetical protein WBN29_04390, partial [Polyangiales bacterium]